MKSITRLILGMACTVALRSAAQSGANSLAIGGASGNAGATVEISASIANGQAFVAFQFDLPLPNQASYVAGSAALTTRANGHTLSAKVLSGNVLRIVAYSNNNSTFSGSSGSVMTFQLRLGAAPGNYSLPPTNASISNASGTNILTGTVTGTLTLLAPNISLSRTTITYTRTLLNNFRDESFTITNTGNATLNVACAVTPQIFAVQGSSSFNLGPSQSQNVVVRFQPVQKGTFTGQVTVTSNDPDAATMSVGLNGVGYTLNELYVNHVFARSGTDATISLRIRNDEPFVGFQFELNLPAALTFIPNSERLTSRSAGHQVKANVKPNGKLQVVAYSSNNTPFSGNDGNVVELDFHVEGVGGFYGLVLSTVIIADQAGGNLLSDFYNETLEIIAPDINSAGSVNYGSISRLDTATAVINIQNNGSDVLVVTSFSSEAPQFWADEVFPKTIPIGQNTNVVTRFHSGSAGAFSGRFTARSNDPDEDPFYINVSGAAYSPNIMRIQDAIGNVNANVQLFVAIDNLDPFVAFQFDLQLPNGFTLLPDSCKLTNRSQGHSLVLGALGGNKYRFFAYALNNATFTGNTGAAARLLCFINQAGTYVLNPQNALIGDAAGRNIISSSIAGILTVNQPLPPTISFFTPTSGPVGTPVIITGTNFTGATQVAFNGTVASPFTSDSDAQISTTVPTGATTGKISVTTPAGTAISANDFSIIPNLAINDVTITEGNTGTVNAVFTVTLSTTSSQQITVDYSTADGSATAGSDYVATPTTQLIIPANTTTQTITVQVNGDVLDETDETFFVNLSNPTNAVITDNQGQGTITDDDPLPALSINDISVAEGNIGTTNATFTVSLSAASGKQVTVDYATADGTANAGSDYVSIPTTQLIFPAGTTTQSVTVTVNGDALNEPDETFFINLSNADNADISDGQGQGTIQNDDAIIIPTLSINDVSVIEGNSGTINAVFTVTLSAASSQQITVDYVTANGTATAGSDYVAIPTTQLIFPSNTTTQTITVIVNGDLFDESDETFLVNLSNPANATLADAQGLGTISDDDSPAQTITLNPTDDAYVNANQPTSNFGTATTLRMKQSSPIVNSYLKFVVTTITGPIQSAKIRMTVTVASSSGGSIYSVSNNYLGTSTPWIETGLNYNNAPAISGTPWDTEGTVTVGQVVEFDVTPAITGNGTFSFGLKNSSTTTVQYSSEEGATKPQLVIQTGATFPSLSINDVTVTEGNVGNVNATFTASLSAPSSQVVTVSYSTADGTASAGSDYVSASGIVSFPIGTTTQSVTISVIGDAVIESNETFSVNLSNSTNATIADAQGQGTITDDDIMTITLNPTDDAYVNANQATTNFGTQTTLRMRLSSPIINSYLKFTVNGVSGTVLSAKLRMAVTVASSSGGSIYSVSNNYLGTSTPWIETGLNYNNAPTISGTPWDTEGSVTVGQVVELDVTPAITGNGAISFGLKNSSNTTVQYSSEEGATKPQLIIQFAPGPPSLSINDITVLESNSGTVNASFTVSLSAASSQIVSVNFATANGTATAGSDYVAASGNVTFPIGVTTQPMTVAVIGDVLTESNETFQVNLTNPVNATLADAQGIGTITDDDAVTMTLNPTDDTFVRSDQTTANFGTQTTLRMKQSSPILNSYLKFVVSGVTGTVLSAKLRMAVTVASSSGGSVYAVSNNYQGTSTPWLETGVNYSNAPIISGTPLDTEGSVSVGQVVEFNVASAITGNGTFSFGLNNASTATVQYSSKEGATKPELVIQFGASAATKIVDSGSQTGDLQSIEITESLAEKFELALNYPNPFNAQTVIEYALPEAAHVRLAIYNVLGQRVRLLVDENQIAGYKRVVWEARNELGTEAGSGIYFLQLTAGRHRFVRKMFLQR